MIVSFGWTVEPLLRGQKTVTRRRWASEYVARWQRAWDRGPRIHKAYDKAAYAGGKPVGWIILTARPYNERLEDMPVADLAAEGGLWGSVDEFVRFIDCDPWDTVTVIRFSFQEGGVELPMNKALYPRKWNQIATRVKNEANWTCENCGRECYRPGEPCPDRAYVLTVHHLDGNPSNCHRSNLVAVCPACHNAMDAPMRTRHRAQTRRARQEDAGQMRMELG